MTEYDIREPALDEWLPVDDALQQRLLPVLAKQYLPVAPPVEAVPDPVVIRYDPWPARLVAAGAFVALSGGGVWLAGTGVRAAGPYLWALAAALGALAGLIALIKSHGAGNSGNTTITVERSRNVRIGR
jgi:hypothetical protein